MEQSMQEENMLEQRMDFIISSSIVRPELTAKARAPERSEEEKEMWDRYILGNEVFNAGTDHTHAAVQERNRLEREAGDFDLWHGADFVSGEDPNDAELILDGPEQDEIMAELLGNARKYIPYHFGIVQCLYFGQTCMHPMRRTYLLKNHGNPRLAMLGRLTNPRWRVVSFSFRKW